MKIFITKAYFLIYIYIKDILPKQKIARYDGLKRNQLHHLLCIAAQILGYLFVYML